MKGSPQSPVPVIEWSPSHCAVYSPSTDKVVEVESLQLAKGLVGSEAVIALSRRTSFVRTTRVPDASKDDVGKILAIQLGQLFPVDPASLSIDFVLTANKNMDGRLAVVAAVQTETLRELNHQLNQAGIRPVAIVPCALGSALLANQLGKAEGAVVRESREGIAIDVVHEGELAVSRVAVANSEPGAVEQEICRTFGIAKLPCGESIASGGFVFQGANVSTALFDLKCLSTAIPDINLRLPEEVAKQKAQKVTRAKNLALLMCVATVGVAAVVYDIRAGDAALIDKDNKRWGKQLSDLRKAKSLAEAKVAELTKRNQAVVLAFQPKQRLSDVAAVISSLAPEGVWLTGFTVERGKEATIRGTATTEAGVQAYLANMANEARLRDVKLIFANNALIESTNVVQFSMTAHVVGNFPLEQPKKGGRK